MEQRMEMKMEMVECTPEDESEDPCSVHLIEEPSGGSREPRNPYDVVFGPYTLREMIDVIQARADEPETVEFLTQLILDRLEDRA